MLRLKRNRSVWNDPEHKRPRVLLECPAERSPSIIATVMERHGMDVHICEGPAHGAKCSKMETGLCPAVDEADVVVNMLGQDHSYGRRIAEAVLTLPDGPALVLQASEAECARGDVPTEGAIILRPFVRSGGLISAIRQALRRKALPTSR